METETIQATYLGTPNRARDLLIIVRSELKAQLGNFKEKRKRLAQRLLTLKRKAKLLGFAQGVRAAKLEELKQLESIERQFLKLIKDAEQRCYELIIQIADEVVSTEVKVNLESLRKRIQTAISGMGAIQTLFVHVHPSQQQELSKLLQGRQIIPDPEVEIGSAIIKSSSGSVLVDWKKHLREIESLLCKHS